jgi:hypothetical protein
VDWSTVEEDISEDDVLGENDDEEEEAAPTNTEPVEVRICQIGFAGRKKRSNNIFFIRF